MQEIALGILGLGARSTAFYVSELNRQYNLKKGGYCTCPFILLNTDFDAINSLLPNTSPQLDKITKGYIEAVEKTGIEHILIPNITLHETIDRLAVGKQVIHPVHLAISKIRQERWRKVIIFGTLHTMQGTYITAQLIANNIEVVLPTMDDMLRIDEIRKHIYSGTETEELIQEYLSLVKQYSERYPVVLSCTELSIVTPLGMNDLIDMAQLQIAEALGVIL